MILYDSTETGTIIGSSKFVKKQIELYKVNKEVEEEKKTIRSILQNGGTYTIEKEDKNGNIVGAIFQA